MGQTIETHIAAPAFSSGAARPRIVAILPRGEAIRNFVYSGTLASLEQHADVHLLTVIPNEAVRRELQRGAVSLTQLEKEHEPWLAGAVRELLDMAHGRHLWSEAAQERWRLRDSEAVTRPQKAKRIAKKMLCVPFTSRFGIRSLAGIERTISRVLARNVRLERYYDRVRPDLVFNGSHVHSELAIPAVQTAQWLGIGTAAFLFSWDNLTSQGRILTPYDNYLVWNRALQDQLLRIYPHVNQAQVHITGTPQFDFHFREEFHWTRSEFCRNVGADESRPIILYTTGMANHMPGEEVVVERLADIIASLPFQPRPQLQVRIYAKDRTERFHDLRRRRHDILFPETAWDAAFLTPRLEDQTLFTNMLRHCAVGINVASTVSLELCMFGKPVINVGYDPPGRRIAPVSYARYYEFDHYVPVVRAGAVRVAWSEAEAADLLLDALRNPHRDRDRRKAFLDEMFGSTLDGGSSERVAATLLALAETRTVRPRRKRAA